MSKAFSLPRERHEGRATSIYQRSARKGREACAMFRANPNPGTLERRRDRTLARYAQRARLAFVRAYASTNLRGAARTSHVRKLARSYREALRAWAANYDRASGWDAYVRTNKQIRTFPVTIKAGR
jgi:hypothetical protein